MVSDIKFIKQGIKKVNYTLNIEDKFKDLSVLILRLNNSVNVGQDLIDKYTKVKKLFKDKGANF